MLAPGSCPSGPVAVSLPVAQARLVLVAKGQMGQTITWRRPEGGSCHHSYLNCEGQWLVELLTKEGVIKQVTSLPIHVFPNSYDMALSKRQVSHFSQSS